MKHCGRLGESFNEFHGRAILNRTICHEERSQSAILNLAVIARPLMKELSLLAKETVLLTAVDGMKGVCLERVESEEPIRFSLLQPGGWTP
jgi:DNA-binding IclR family transcriptional regulator